LYKDEIKFAFSFHRKESLLKFQQATKLTVNWTLSDVVRRNLCYFKPNKAIITQLRGEYNTLFCFFSLFSAMSLKFLPSEPSFRPINVVAINNAFFSFLFFLLA